MFPEGSSSYLHHYGWRFPSPPWPQVSSSAEKYRRPSIKCNFSFNLYCWKISRLHAKEEIQCDFEAAYVTWACPLALWTQKEKSLLLRVAPQRVDPLKRFLELVVVHKCLTSLSRINWLATLTAALHNSLILQYAALGYSLCLLGLKCENKKIQCVNAMLNAFKGMYTLLPPCTSPQCFPITPHCIMLILLIYLPSEPHTWYMYLVPRVQEKP